MSGDETCYTGPLTTCQSYGIIINFKGDMKVYAIFQLLQKLFSVHQVIDKISVWTMSIIQRVTQGHIAKHSRKQIEANVIHDCESCWCQYNSTLNPQGCTIIPRGRFKVLMQLILICFNQETDFCFPLTGTVIIDNIIFLFQEIIYQNLINFSFLSGTKTTICVGLEVCAIIVKWS